MPISSGSIDEAIASDVLSWISYAADSNIALMAYFFLQAVW